MLSTAGKILTHIVKLGPRQHLRRTILSQAYYCKEPWDSRLSSPLLQKINFDILYYELDQGFQNFRQISAVDVDIFANALKDDLYVDELVDLVHKLRLTAETGNALESTGHAVIRCLLEHDRIDELLSCLNDRINYGIFLDNYTGNLLMDTFWKTKNYVGGAQIASQFMLQEDFSHPVTTDFALLHCFMHLSNPKEWPVPKLPEEPAEEVKIRVKYLRNPYFDDHFDLTDGNKIVGKTLAMASKGQNDSLNRSFNILGLILLNKATALDSIKYCNQNNIPLIKEILDLVPPDNELKRNLNDVKLESANVQEILEKQLEQHLTKTSERDISSVCQLYKKWELQRMEALEEQKRRIDVAARLARIEDIKQNLTLKEQKLWFFEKQEDIELNIETGQVHTDVVEVKSKGKKGDEDYVPPEITVKRPNLS